MRLAARPAQRLTLGTLSAIAALLAACGGSDRLNVVLITLDTTRADHLGCYGYQHIETPSIDRLAAEGTLYERCYTPVPITLPSHLSILTGTYPTYHGVRENNGFYVAPELNTLAEILQNRGYDTAAFVGAFPLDSQTGLDQGFDLYDDNYPSSLEHGRHPSLQGFFDERPASEVVRPALEWLAARGQRPFFLWTHFFDPHQPQIPPSPYSERYSGSLYDGEIASVDEAVGRLLARLEEQGELDRTLIVLTADHGESLGDHGEITHALLLYSSTIRVPLIVRDPRVPGSTRVRAPVATVDILPTILDRLGLDTPLEVQGVVLPASDREPTRPRAILTETLYGALLHGWSPLERLTTGDRMIIDGPSPKLYHLADDPGETRDLAAERPAELADLQRLLGRRKRQLSAGGIRAAQEESISPEKQARLAALGYLSSGSKVEVAGLEVSAELPDPHLAIAGFREMNEGKRLAERGQPALGAAILRRAQAADPTNPFLSQHLALAYQRLGDTEALRRELDHLLDIAPEHLAAHLMLAELQTSELNEEGAMRTLGRAIELDPKNQATRLIYAHRLEDAGNDAEARESYQELLALAPGHTLARNGYAALIYRLGEIDAAVDGWEQLLREQPFYAPAHLNLAVVRHDSGQIEESERHVLRAIELRPSYGRAYELHAMNLTAQGDAEGAHSAWESARRFAADGAARSRAESEIPATE